MNIAEWGNATWFIFHTLAYKLKDGYTSEIGNLCKHFMLICGNLPCPDCRQHAISILSKSNIKNIKTRDQLIHFLLQFHNIVNRRLKKSEFSIEEHNKLYSRSYTVNIINNFINIMSKNANNSKAMLDTFSRKRVVSNFVKYLKAQQHIFNP